MTAKQKPLRKTLTAETRAALDAYAHKLGLDRMSTYTGVNDTIEELLEEARYQARLKAARKTRALRRRHEMTKFWISNPLAARLDALGKALKAEGEDERRFADTPSLVEYLLSLHDQIDAARIPPLGGFIGGIEDSLRCGGCAGPVARVYDREGKRVAFVSPCHPSRALKALDELRAYTTEWAPARIRQAVIAGRREIPPVLSVEFLTLNGLARVDAERLNALLDALAQAIADQDEQMLCPSCGGPVEEAMRKSGPFLVRAATPAEVALAFEALRDFVPAAAPRKVLRSYEQNGAEKGAIPPLFSEMFLYELLGKDSARSVLGRLRELGTTLGIKERY